MSRRTILRALCCLEAEGILVLDFARRAGAAVIATIAILPAALTAQHFDVLVGSSPTAVVIPNGKLTVPVVVDVSGAGPQNLASLASAMAWSASRFTLDSLRVVAPAWSLSGGLPAGGTTSFTASSAFPLAGTGTLFNAYFTAGAAPGGTRIALAPTAATNAANGNVLSMIRPRSLDACVANSGKGGDVTSDNIVGIVDGQQVARYAVGLAVSDQASMIARGDVDASSSINIIDAQQIARFAIGLPVTPAAAARINLELFTPPAVSGVSVSPPASQTLAAGNTLQIVATPVASGTDLTGCASVTWASSNTSVAAVSPSGLVTALSGGTTTITAASATSPAAKASVNITVPSAATVLFTEDFETSNLGANGWYDNKTAVLSTSEKYSGNSSAQFRYLAGATLPTSGGSMRHKFTPTNSLYISYYVKYSANYVGSGQSYHPHELYAMTNLDATDYEGPSHSWLTVYLEHNFQNGLRPMMGMQDNLSINTAMGTPSASLNLTQLTENRSVSGCNGIVEINMSRDCYATPGTTPPWYNAKTIFGPVIMSKNPGANYMGNWNHIEAYYQLNTIVNGIGAANGVMQYWLNGELIIDRSDVLFRTAARPNMLFNKVLIAPYIGSGSSIDQSMFIDNLVVKTAR